MEIMYGERVGKMTLLPDWPQNGNGLLGKWYADFVPSFLTADTHVIASLLSIDSPNLDSENRLA